jgi:hypothetical protein
MAEVAVKVAAALLMIVGSLAAIVGAYHFERRG